MSSNRHQEHVRRVTGFFWQTLNDRGIRCERNAVAVALQELTEAQFGALENAVHALANGHDDVAPMAFAAAFRRISAPNSRKALMRACVVHRADVLLAVATDASMRQEFDVQLTALQLEASSLEDRARAQEVLRSLCGHTQPTMDVPAQVAHPVVEIDAPGGDDVLPPFEPAEPISTSLQGDCVTPEVFAPPTKAFVGRKAKVFGKTGALTWETALLRQSEALPSGATTTVMVEGAAATGEGTFDWSRKLVFMCTLRELHQVLAVLMGWSGELEMKFHGHDRKKSLVLLHQDHGVLVHLRHDRTQVRVPVDDADRYALAMLVLSALVANEPNLDAQTILTVCQAMAVEPVFRH